MKKSVFFLVFAVCLLALTMPVAARTFVDDMAELSQNNIKRYEGLAFHSFGQNTSALPDATAVSFIDAAYPVAYAQYRVQAATGVVAAIYTHTGAFVCAKPDDPAANMLGVFQENMSFLYAQSLTQAQYCPATNGVYTYTGGLQQLYTDLYEYSFGPVLSQPQGELIGYGVNIYYSLDGRTFTRAAARQTDLRFNTAYMFCYEEYAATVPPSAKYVRVEINDVPNVPLKNGGVFAKAKKQLTALASVTLTGDNLMLGEPEPLVQIAPNSAQSGKEGEGGEKEKEKEKEPSEKSSSSKKAAKPAAESEKAPVMAKSESASVSKFEGTITSSAPSSKSSSSKSASKSKPESEKSAMSSVQSNEIETPPTATVIYEIPRGEEDKRFDSAIIAYIIGISGAILLLILLPRKK